MAVRTRFCRPKVRRRFTIAQASPKRSRLSRASATDWPKRRTKSSTWSAPGCCRRSENRGGMGFVNLVWEKKRGTKMYPRSIGGNVEAGRWYIAALIVFAISVAGQAYADSIEGQVLGAGAPIAKSTVTLWSASADAPKQLAQTQTGDDGRFTLNAEGSPDSILYMVAKGGVPAGNKGGGDNPAIALISVLGNKAPAKITINEMTTVASVWTNAQFIEGTAIKGNALGLRIAAGNVPNFVDLETGGWGSAIQDPLNGPQTPTMANFATLADVLAGCVTRVTADACDKLFAAATPPSGSAPTNTLTAAQSIARYPWYHPKRLYALLDSFYPIPQG